MEVTLVWVGNALFVRGTTIQVAYICQGDNDKWGGIVLGLDGNGVIDYEFSKKEVENVVDAKLLQASKCKQYRSTINGEFLKIQKI